MKNQSPFFPGSFQFVSSSALWLCVLGMWGCSGETQSSTRVDHETLLVATEGTLFHFNLETRATQWNFASKVECDKAGNRNLFVVSEQSIYFPLEGGRFLCMDVNAGKILWEQQILGSGNGIEDGMASASKDGTIEADPNKVPLFMAKPLVYKDMVYMASTGQPETGVGALYGYHKQTGEVERIVNTKTIYNEYAPVQSNGNIFLNSAIYLGKYDLQVIQDDVDPLRTFTRPIYCQMQADAERLYVGDENGQFFAIAARGDIQKTQWTFQEEGFTFQKLGTTFLTDDALYVIMDSGSCQSSCIFALNKKTGKPKWKKVIEGDVTSWEVKENLIVGCTPAALFTLDLSGENFTQFPCPQAPLSNIEVDKNKDLLFVTEKGIAKYKVQSKALELLLKKKFNNNEHNNCQIQYLK